MCGGLTNNTSKMETNIMIFIAGIMVGCCTTGILFNFLKKHEQNEK